jgi:enamine deaminase RidA (YjgF/YER057c/UK114 family)
MKTIRSPKVAEAPPQTWSNMKVSNGYFHIAGMTGSGPKGEHPGDDMYIQAKSIFQKFKDLLEAAGGKMNDIMSITVYVTNLDENTEVWARAPGVLHRRLSLFNLDRGKARWLTQGQPAAQGGDQRDRRNRRGRLVRHSRASSELVTENPDLTVWVVPAIINCGSDPA